MHSPAPLDADSSVRSPVKRNGIWVLSLAAIVVAAGVWIVVARRHVPKWASTGGPAAPLSTRVNQRDGLTYVWIPPGTFTMGCSPEDSECEDDEKPGHEVTITKGFWMGRTEVTQAAYQRLIGSNPSHFIGADLPVEMISGDEARAYCVAAEMRLPTEAEWEYAARGGNSSARYGPPDAVAWTHENSGGTAEGLGLTHKVGQKQANAFGLYDMLGNVWEAVGDWYDAKYYASSPASDPKGPSSGVARALRGGSCYNSSRLARASRRDAQPPDEHPLVGGVRCAGD